MARGVICGTFERHALFFFPRTISKPSSLGCGVKKRSRVCFSRESINSLNTSRSLDSRLCSPGGMKAGLRLNCSGQRRLSPASALFREPQHVGEFPQAYASKRSLNVQVAGGNLCVVYSLCNSERRYVRTIALLHACLSCSLRANKPAQPTRVPPPAPAVIAGYVYHIPLTYKTYKPLVTWGVEWLRPSGYALLFDRQGNAGPSVGSSSLLFFFFFIAFLACCNNRVTSSCMTRGVSLRCSSNCAKTCTSG